jgi:EAL domain-containing protein (putative c-di-GMP-specific phosphodiesterase class I)
VVIPIGAWAIEQACMSAVGWADESMFVTVNVSGVQLRESNFVEGVRRSLRLSGLEPARLVLEITESTLIDDSELATRQLTELRACGISTALDDFGTGYSSLAYVQRLPLDIIKIDREFVQSVNESRSQALANTIVNMARNLGLRTVAEGVESESQALELARIGCEFAQGYLFFKPLSAVAMTALSEFENQPADDGGTTVELPAHASKALPPPSGQLVAVEAHVAPAPPRTHPDEPQPKDEPAGEISHLLRPLLSS